MALVCGLVFGLNNLLSVLCRNRGAVLLNGTGDFCSLASRLSLFSERAVWIPYAGLPEDFIDAAQVLDGCFFDVIL